MNAYDKLTGALIGLAKTTFNDAHTPALLQLLLDGLRAEETMDPARLAALTDSAAAMKRAYAPGCADCASPCGRTADYDLDLLRAAPAELRADKERLLFCLRSIAAGCSSWRELSPETAQLLLDGLCAVGEASDQAFIRPCLQRAEEHIKKQ